MVAFVIVKTAVDVAMDQGRQIGEDSVGIAMIFDDSSRSFARLDSDKYGKISLMSSQEGSLIYSQGLTINGKELVSQNENKFIQWQSSWQPSAATLNKISCPYSHPRSIIF